ncbi:unnamed protein product [Caenorhabditis brenneri]
MTLFMLILRVITIIITGTPLFLHFQSLFAFQVVRTSSSISYFLLPISWDILNVGTPIVMVLASSQLRKDVFGIMKRSRSNSRVEEGTIVTGF